jgi:hypothetical protein
MPTDAEPAPPCLWRESNREGRIESNQSIKVRNLKQVMWRQCIQGLQRQWKLRTAFPHPLHLLAVASHLAPGRRPHPQKRKPSQARKGGRDQGCHSVTAGEEGTKGALLPCHGHRWGGRDRERIVAVSWPPLGSQGPRVRRHRKPARGHPMTYRRPTARETKATMAAPAAR